MSLFVEVFSMEKECPVIVNLDHIVEIAPLRQGGCVLYMNDGAGMNARVGLQVADDFKLFKQFAMETVTSADIEKKFPKRKLKDKGDEKFGFDFDDIPKL